MDIKDKILLIGGDLRQVFLANDMNKDIGNIGVYALESDNLDEDIKIYDNLKKAIKDSKIIILPMPYTKDNLYINASLSDKDILIGELLKEITEDKIVLGGKLKEEFIINCKSKNIFDYLKKEELAVLNAIPTAEGAIEIAIRESNITIHNSKCLVIGYGRIGKVLAKMIRGLGAETYISARKESDLAMIKAFDYETLNTNNLNGYLKQFDFIFNTVPFLILDKDLLATLKKDVIIIDLASNPGGVDFDYAKSMNIKINWALSLPGKVAPKTAASYLKNTIYNILIKEV